MKKGNWKPYLLFIALCLAVGALAGFLTRDGIAAYNTLQKPPGTPPNVVFPIVWSVLYVLMGVGAARIFLAGTRLKDKSLSLFYIQLAVNFFWSLIFFNLQAFGFAFVWLVLLWILILLMILLFYKSDRTAGLLQIPYLLWVTYAGYLNLGILLLNR